MTDATLSEQLRQVEKHLDKLARLGNAPRLGNSVGNCIAQESLALMPSVIERVEALEAAALPVGEDAVQRAAELYEMKRARYCGGIDYYRDNQVAFVECMKAAQAPLLAKLAEREAEVQRLRKALAYVADRAWVAVSPRAGDWVREFADVAGKALARDEVAAESVTAAGSVLP